MLIKGWLYFVSLLSLGLLLIYGLRPDWAAAVTIFPAWAWLWVWVLALPFYKRVVFRGICVIWLVFIIFMVEEPRSLVRGWIPAFYEAPNEFFATTVNCSGKIEPVLQAMKRADVLFIQESPGYQALSEFCKAESFDLLYGPDTSIVVRLGALSPVESNLFFNTGIWTYAGKRVILCSLRLTASTPRIDLWSRSCWEGQRQRREHQLRQMDEIVSSFPEEFPVMVGGDFNVPQGDKIFDSLPAGMRDSFSGAGVGLCNTMTTDYPFIRIDQIWTSSEIQCKKSYATVSLATDHRLYTGYFVADFLMPELK